MVNDSVLVNVTCGAATATVVVTAPAAGPTSMPAADTADDADAVTGRDVMMCWMLGALDLM